MAKEKLAEPKEKSPHIGKSYEEIIDELEKKLNEFIKRIWINYDQELKISLEENQILIQF